jgi:hypothetical protein
VNIDNRTVRVRTNFAAKPRLSSSSARFFAKWPSVFGDVVKSLLDLLTCARDAIPTPLVRAN